MEVSIALFDMTVFLFNANVAINKHIVANAYCKEYRENIMLKLKIQITFDICI